MKSQVSPLCACPSRPGRSGAKAALPQVLGLLGLSCCSEVYSPSVLEPMADPDLASPMTGPDLAPPTTTPDPAGTISVRDCAAKTLIQAINAANDTSSVTATPAATAPTAARTAETVKLAVAEKHMIEVMAPSW